MGECHEYWTQNLFLGYAKYVINKTECLFPQKNATTPCKRNVCTGNYRALSIPEGSPSKTWLRKLFDICAPPTHKLVHTWYSFVDPSPFCSYEQPFKLFISPKLFISQSGQGYLSWRIKTVQRNNSDRKSPISIKTFDGGPTAQRQVAGTSQHSDEDCVNAISLMKHSVDEETVKQKMRSTFRYRRNMVEDPERCGDVLAEYPRFKDVKGLVSNDFQVDACIYGLNWVMSRDISQWPNYKIKWTYFENRISIDRFMVSKTTLFFHQDWTGLRGADWRGHKQHI